MHDYGEDYSDNVYQDARSDEDDRRYWTGRQIFITVVALFMIASLLLYLTLPLLQAAWQSSPIPPTMPPPTLNAPTV